MALVDGHTPASKGSAGGQNGVSSAVGRVRKELEILTLYPTESEASPAPPQQAGTKTVLKADWATTSKKENAIIPWKDTLLKKLEGKASGQTLLWLPGSGRHVSEGPDAYQPFTHVTRTLHLEDALEVCAHRRIRPKNIITFSSIDSRALPPGHPCADLKVLWFSAGVKDQDEGEDRHDWYGNVEFAVDASILLECWKYSFLVEMMTTPTHTTSRILLTNTDFSGVLRPYNPYCAGGPWQVSAEGQLALRKCSRYRFVGTNRHPHILEFLLDTSVRKEKKLLQACQLSFKNHEEAQDLTVRHVCNRYQRAKTACPTPFPRSVTATVFAMRLQQMNVPPHYVPKLSSESQQLYNEAMAQINFPFNKLCVTPLPYI